MGTGIVIIVYNLPIDIFLLQIAAIRKYCKDDFTIEVFDNSDNLEIAEHIRYHSAQLGVNYYKIFSNSKGGSDSHCWAANFAFQKLKDEYKYFWYIDHDAIPVKDISVEDILKNGHVIAGVGQGAKKKYFWPGHVMWCMERIDKWLIDFSTNADFQLDTGGNLYKIVEKYGEESCIFFNESYHQNQYYKGLSYNHYSMLADNSIMHFVNSSSWNAVEDNEARINGLINIAKEKTGL